MKLDLYTEISDFFRQNQGKIVELEILPKWHLPPLCIDGQSLGITKNGLIQAFTVARQLFFDNASKMISYNELTDKNVAAALDATLVVLFFAPEHTTAINFRKRRLLFYEQEALREPGTDSEEVGRYMAAIHNELALLQSFTSSYLVKHPKSPTLWDHRRWIFSRQSYLHQIEPSRSWEVEKGVVLRAAEQHQHNYYAFNYLRTIFGIFSRELSVYIPNDMDSLRRWCLANPRDASGWSFFVFLFENCETVDLQLESTPNHIMEVAEFADSLQWSSPNLWSFLRRACTILALECPESSPIKTRLRNLIEANEQGMQPFKLKVHEFLLGIGN
ncbi:MAG: hypothetical protein M1834_002072 [Cirrosporium novae-zelandiae]|nr:MAG: hypothetical protein M1834_002072 [Cirrosporium novae-zelandiae]